MRGAPAGCPSPGRLRREFLVRNTRRAPANVLREYAGGRCRLLHDSWARWRPSVEQLRRTPLYEQHEELGRQIGALRGLGDAGPLRGDQRGALRGPHPRRDVRRLPHGRGRGRGARGARLPAAGALQRRREDRRRRRPVLLPLQRGRRGDRRPLLLPPRQRPLPDRHQRGQPRDRPRLARALVPRLRRRRPRRRRPLRDARRAGPARPRRARRARSASSCRSASTSPPTTSAAGRR